MNKKVTIYSTPTCGYCRVLKDYLKERNIEYIDYDVAQDKAKAQEMVDKTGQMGVPVVVISGDNNQEEVIIGFDKIKINQALGIE